MRTSSTLGQQTARHSNVANPATPFKSPFSRTYANLRTPIKIAIYLQPTPPFAHSPPLTAPARVYLARYLAVLMAVPFCLELLRG